MAGFSGCGNAKMNPNKELLYALVALNGVYLK
jgi:hypothetical protein